jgi:hypothetical protein
VLTKWASNVVVLWRVFKTAATGEGLHCDCPTDDVRVGERPPAR